MLVVASGKYRSRKLDVPARVTVPSKAIVRDAMLNALGTQVLGAAVLDLFAGSGALGIEALSRGASSCVFVDSDADAVKVITKNLATLSETNGKVLLQDFRSYIENANEIFDIVFLDPPYRETGFYDEAIRSLLDHHRLSDHAAVVLEFEGEPPRFPDAFKEIRSYHYGRTKVLIAWR